MEFRNDLGKHVFDTKYRHKEGGCETWAGLAHRVVQDVCEGMHDEEKDRLEKYIREKKFIPGGRYLYYAGREKRFYNNCFSGKQGFVTAKGIKTFSETAGKDVDVLSPVTGNFVRASVKDFGSQSVYRLTFKTLRGHQRRKWEVLATKDHRWILVNGEETTDLRVGDVVPLVSTCIKESSVGWLHGAIFADGSMHKCKKHFGYQLRLCGKKASFLDKLEPHSETVTYPDFANGDPVLYVKSSCNYKELPTKEESPEYISGFLRGYFSFDGHDGKSSKSLHSINKDAIEFFSKNCYLIGAVRSGVIKEINTPANLGERKNTLYKINISFSDRFCGFKLVSKELIGKEKVYCVVEPRHGQFVLEDGIVTGNCFLLKSEEDTREDWANLVYKAQSALSSGGGIGNDYSIYRKEGAPLKRTGGSASGPIKAMQIVNEIGRYVQQGG